MLEKINEIPQIFQSVQPENSTHFLEINNIFPLIKKKSSNLVENEVLQIDEKAYEDN